MNDPARNLVKCYLCLNLFPSNQDGSVTVGDNQEQREFCSECWDSIRAAQLIPCPQ